MKEEWRDISGYEGRYEVSNLGQVRSYCQSATPRLRKISKCKGDSVVTLKKKGRDVLELVHRLVATAFIPNPQNKAQVNHINGDKADNCVLNLEWVAPKENTRHAQNTLGHDYGSARRDEGIKVRCVETGVVYPTASAAARAYHRNTSAVSALLRDPYRNKTCAGLHWEYV